MALLIRPLIANRLVVVLLVEDALVVKKLVEVLLVVRKLVDVLFVATRFVNVATNAVNTFVLKLFAVILFAVRSVIVVVARVDVPKTRSVPDAERFPCGSAVKLRLSTHAVPFQYKVELVAVPSATAPDIGAQNVDVPVVARNCPGAPT